MINKEKQVYSDLRIAFSTSSELPSESAMKREVEELFAATFDKYLHDKGIEGNEVHFVFCDFLEIGIDGED